MDQGVAVKHASIGISIEVKDYSIDHKYNEGNPVIGLYSDSCRQHVFMHGTREDFEVFISMLQDCLNG